jgi:hypothetical protein
MTPAGFPHSDILGSKSARDSPRLNAACHVLHRLLAPRHPPRALCSLTSASTWPGGRCGTGSIGFLDIDEIEIFDFSFAVTIQLLRCDRRGDLATRCDSHRVRSSDPLVGALFESPRIRGSDGSGRRHETTARGLACEPSSVRAVDPRVVSGLYPRLFAFCRCCLAQE